MNPTASVPSIFDTSNLAALKGAVSKDDPKALKAAAQQFEALFMQMVLKSMRDATPHEGMFDSDQSRMYESLLDQQLAQVMAGKGSLGLAALIERQLARPGDDPVAFETGIPLAPGGTAPLPFNEPGRPLPLDTGKASSALLPLDRTPVIPAGNGATSALPAATGITDRAADIEVSPAAREFVSRVWPHAVEASRATGIPAHFLVAQAALETGWGRAEPRLADGRPSNNLFGLKAGRSWSGQTVDAVTTEYAGGVAGRQNERFRVYDSYADSFRDYAGLILGNPRYASVVGVRDAGTFARGLQRAGYATDPLYADKLERIIGGQTLRGAMTA